MDGRPTKSEAFRDYPTHRNVSRFYANTTNNGDLPLRVDSGISYRQGQTSALSLIPSMSTPQRTAIVPLSRLSGDVTTLCAAVAPQYAGNAAAETLRIDLLDMLVISTPCFRLRDSQEYRAPQLRCVGLGFIARALTEGLQAIVSLRIGPGP